MCSFMYIGGLIEGAVAGATAIIMSGGLLAGPAATGVVEGGNAGALVGTVLCPWLISKKGKRQNNWDAQTENLRERGQQGRNIQ